MTVAGRATSRARRFFGHTGYRKFIVLARSRTGSYLLVSFLDSHPNIRAQGEILRNLNGRDYRKVVDRAFGREPRSVRAKGFKIFYYHPNDDRGSKVWDLLHGMDDLHVLHMRRENVLRTALSRKIAANQEVWRVTHPDEMQPPEQKLVAFTVDELTREFEKTRRWEREAPVRFAGHPFLTITYEDLVADTAATFRAVTDFLGVPYAAPSTTMVRQNPEPLSTLITNYEELRSAFADTEWASFFDSDP